MVSPELVDFGNFNESINKKTSEDSIDFNFKFKISMIEFEKEFRFKYNRNLSKGFMEKLFSDEFPQVDIELMIKVKSKFISSIELKALDYVYNIQLSEDGKISSLVINDKAFPINNLYSSNYGSKRNITYNCR